MEGLGNGRLGRWCTVARSNLDICWFAGCSSMTYLWSRYLCSDGVQYKANWHIIKEFISNFCSIFEGNIAKEGKKGAKIVLFCWCGSVSCTYLHDSRLQEPQWLSTFASDSPIWMGIPVQWLAKNRAQKRVSSYLVFFLCNHVQEINVLTIWMTCC